MHVARIVLATVLAPFVAALPYFALGVWAFSTSGGGPSAQGGLFSFVIVFFGAGVGVVCLSVARVAWKYREMVPRRALIAVPTGVAIVFFFLTGVLPGLAFGGGAWIMLPFALVVAVAAMVFGRIAAAVWMRYAFDGDQRA